MKNKVNTLMWLAVAMNVLSCCGNFLDHTKWGLIFNVGSFSAFIMFVFVFLKAIWDHWLRCKIFDHKFICKVIHITMTDTKGNSERKSCHYHRCIHCDETDIGEDLTFE